MDKGVNMKDEFFFWVGIVLLISLPTIVIRYLTISDTNKAAYSAVGGVYKELQGTNFLCLSPESLKEVTK